MIEAFFPLFVVFCWTPAVILFAYIAFELALKKRLEQRLLLPPYTAKLMAQTLLSDDDNKWKVFLETGIISYPNGKVDYEND